MYDLYVCMVCMHVCMYISSASMICMHECIETRGCMYKWMNELREGEVRAWRVPEQN
jgi:hypothetical protein